MKITVEPKDAWDAIICLETECRWKRVCANHMSAGDYRSEGGTRPILKLRSGELHCETFDSSGNGCNYYEEPLNTEPWITNRWNMVLWSQLIEEIDNFNI